MRLTDIFGGRELKAEAEMVMQLWEQRGGLSRHHITGIRRVQNMTLWTKYAMTRAEIQASLDSLSLHWCGTTAKACRPFDSAAQCFVLCACPVLAANVCIK